MDPLQVVLLAAAVAMIVAGLIMTVNDSLPKPILKVSGVKVETGSMGTNKWAVIHDLPNVDRKMEALVQQHSVREVDNPFGPGNKDTHYNIPGLFARVVPENDTTYPLVAKFTYKKQPFDVIKRYDAQTDSFRFYGGFRSARKDGGLESEYTGLKEGRIEFFIVATDVDYYRGPG